MSYAELTGGSGIQWPCNEARPHGTRRLYTDHQFPTHCETYGHDLVTGAEIQPEHYRANDPAGRAMFKAAEYQPPHELPDGDHPFMLTTGRLVYHFHTRTKTGRSRPLVEAAPDAFVQLAEVDAERLGIAEADLVRVTSRRGSLDAPARLGGMQPAEVFVPFHDGYWDEPGRTRAANELTLYGWDPVSKQPHFKYAAVKLEKVESPSRQPADTASSSEHGLLGSIIGTVGALAQEALQFAKRAALPPCGTRTWNAFWPRARKPTSGS